MCKSVPGLPALDQLIALTNHAASQWCWSCGQGCAGYQRRGDRLLPARVVSRCRARPRRPPASARLQAADRIVERILGKVGEKLLAQKAERREVTVRYDVERLAEIVGELKRMGAID